MIDFGIYFLGYIIMYYYMRYIIRKEQGNDYSWEDVGSCIVGSLSSWGGTVVLLLIWLYDKFSKLPKIKPPKFL
jgi:hypothetical protein